MIPLPEDEPAETTGLIPDLNQASSKAHSNPSRPLVRTVLVGMSLAGFLIGIVFLLSGRKSWMKPAPRHQSCAILLGGVHKVTCMPCGPDDTQEVTLSIYLGWQPQGPGSWKYYQLTDPTGGMDMLTSELDEGEQYILEHGSTYGFSGQENRQLGTTNCLLGQEEYQFYDDASNRETTISKDSGGQRSSTVLLSSSDRSCHFERIYGSKCEKAVQKIQSASADDDKRKEDDDFFTTDMDDDNANDQTTMPTLEQLCPANGSDK